MAENMFCKNQKATSDKFRENWERTFEKSQEIVQKHNQIVPIEIDLSCIGYDLFQECMRINYEKGKPLYR